MEYDPSKVKLSIKTHTKDCASNKSTFSHYKEASEEELRAYLYDFDEVTYKDIYLYGDKCRWFYANGKSVAKGSYKYGEMCFYIYSEEGYGEKFECDCDMIDHEIVGFASDEPITIKRK